MDNSRHPTARTMIIAFLNQKGGVGKTTLATHLAGELVARGRSAVVIDADPQGSALDWAQRRHQRGLQRLFGVVGLPERRCISRHRSLHAASTT